MATPTPMRHAPSQQGRTPSHQGPTPSQIAGATPPISTPFSNPAQAAFSPRGQRSSPQQVKKSPATSTLMSQSGMGALNFDSPSTAAAMGALGIGGSFDIGLDNVGVGGLDTLGVAFATEDDKLKRLDNILKLLNQKKGFVSEAGLERLAQRLGLELLSEEHTALDGRKTKTLAIAGSAIAVDIVLDNNIVQNVSLAYHGSAPSVSKHMEAASQILLTDLKLGPNQSPLTKTLDKFASNFGYIANLDKLSVIPGLDCYEALAGIFTSLERLHQWDISNLRKEPEMEGKPDQYLSLAALCTRHGYPLMHARNKVGLALQYWKELRFVPPPDDKMTIFPENEEKVWSLLLACAPIEALGLSPVRVSEDWISKDVVKQDHQQQDQPLEPANLPILDWQEPENISLPSSDENKNAGMEVLQLDLSTMPQVTFTVTFDPPVILPQNDCIRLYSYVNATPPNPSPSSDFGQRPLPPPTFDDLFFPISAGSKQDPSESRTITRLRDVRVFDQHGKSFTRSHHNTLFIYKPIYSQEVTEMSFSHPRQLIDMLPLLRQFAFLSTLLNNSFGSKTKEDLAKASKASPAPVATKTVKDELAAFMASSDEDEQGDEVGEGQKVKQEAEQDTKRNNGERGTGKDMDMDVILWVHPSPYLQVVFPVKDSTIDITLRILEGGVVEIVNENVVEQQEKKGKGKSFGRQDLGKALERLEDLCKWAEWIRTRLC
ncbi:mediator complex, subunit med1 [Trichoderma arundinaceum]|uniref:Mediator of RNA polymerase II transcription subunit 1 n=1 Tax=Trichoderma arundinaceum TaxID=490622 RepID=A0A395NAR4_TRIAR|nr:mediator complex, subunit med1 [Trichoderma arundinaceum]